MLIEEKFIISDLLLKFIWPNTENVEFARTSDGDSVSEIEKFKDCRETFVKFVELIVAVFKYDVLTLIVYGWVEL